jgi:hypothetical protein
MAVLPSDLLQSKLLTSAMSEREYIESLFSDLAKGIGLPVIEDSEYNFPIDIEYAFESTLKESCVQSFVPEKRYINFMFK